MGRARHCAPDPCRPPTKRALYCASLARFAAALQRRENRRRALARDVGARTSRHRLLGPRTAFCPNSRPRRMVGLSRFRRLHAGTRMERRRTRQFPAVATCWAPPWSDSRFAIRSSKPETPSKSASSREPANCGSRSRPRNSHGQAGPGPAVAHGPFPHHRHGRGRDRRIAQRRQRPQQRQRLRLPLDDQLANSCLRDLRDVSALLQTHVADTAEFIARDPHGNKLPTSSFNWPSTSTLNTAIGAGRSKVSPAISSISKKSSPCSKATPAWPA